MKIVDFYNQGAQVVIETEASNMTHTFTSSPEDGEDVQIGYVPRSNSKLAEGASYDVLEHDGVEYLLLKAGHVYDVKLGDDEMHVISAEEGHISLPLPKGVEVEVDEHDPNAEPPAGTPLTEEEQAAASLPTDPNAGDPKTVEEEQAEAMLGDKNGADAKATEE